MGLVLASATLCLAPGVSSAVDAVSNLGTRLAVQLRDDSGSSVQVTTLGLTYTIVQRLGIEHYGELARTDEARLAKQLGTLRILTPRGQETTLLPGG